MHVVVPGATRLESVLGAFKLLADFENVALLGLLLVLGGAGARLGLSNVCRLLVRRHHLLSVGVHKLLDEFLGVFGRGLRLRKLG